MNVKNISIDFDDFVGTLYLKYLGSSCWVSRESEFDWNYVLSMNKEKAVVGLIVLGANEVTEEEWSDFQGKAEIPEDLLFVLDTWFNLQWGKINIEPETMSIEGKVYCHYLAEELRKSGGC